MLPMDEADMATTRVHVIKIRKQNVRRCLALIAQLLEKHLMTAEADVSVDNAR